MFFDEWEHLSKPTIRPATPSDARRIARIHVDGWRSTYQDIIPPEILKKLRYADYERTWMRLIAGGDTGLFVYVAEHPRDGIIGFIARSIARTDNPDYTSEVTVIYVAEDHQRKGIGSSLMNYVTRVMMENAHRGMMLWAFDGSPANVFFQKLGGQVIARRTRTLDGDKIAEVAYGWANLSMLLDASDEHHPEPTTNDEASNETDTPETANPTAENENS